MSQRVRGPPPPFIDTRRGGVHVWEISKVIVFPPNWGCAVDEHCGKYTVGYGVECGSRPGKLPGLAEIAPVS